MSDSSLSELWFEVCGKQKIPQETAKRWLDTIETKYNRESHRFYHNANILNQKCDFIRSLDSSAIGIPDYLIFAIVFQYFHYDTKSECSEKNRNVFREFCTEAGIDDVSKNEIE